MADATTVVEGKVKYREGKKWKSRWCVLKKPSPVADRLQLVLYKDVHEALRAGGRVKASFPLEGYYGVESGFTFDRENNVLAIICHKQIALMAFETRETVIQFEVKIRRSLGQEYQFPVRLVKVPSWSRLPLEGMKLLIHGTQFCLTAQIPPRIQQSWNVADLRRFGAVDGKFCFEGGSRCGKGAGVHALQTEQAEEIAEILRVNSLGKSAGNKNANNRKIRPVPLPLYNPPPHLLGLSPRLPPTFCPRPSPRPSGPRPSGPRSADTVSNLWELRYTTPLVVSVESLEDAAAGLADRVSLSSQGSCLSVRSFDDTIIRSSPAATVLRPRSGRDYQVVERRRTGSGSASPSPAMLDSPADSNVFTYEGCVLTPKSPDSGSLTSVLTQDCEPSPHRHYSRAHSLAHSVLFSKDKTPPATSAKDTSSPPKLLPSYRRAQSEPCSSRADSPVVISPYANSSPTSPYVPNSALLSPEVMDPILNYAEIDLTVPPTPPPKQIMYSFRRHKKPPAKPTVIEYTQIDHTATVALEKAGREHAQSREGDSLRRGVPPLLRKNSTPLPSKDRKGSSNSFRERHERKLSTCSMESV